MKKLIPVLCVVVLLASCDKEVPPTPSEILASPAKGWTYSEYKVTRGALTVDYLVGSDDCDIDELTVFKSDGTYRIENPVKCDSTEPAVWEEGTWTLTNNNGTLTFTPTGDAPYSVTIVEITATQVKITTTVDLGGGQSGTASITVVPKQ